MKILNLILVKIFQFLIRVYQKTLSFDHGFLKFLYPYGFCRYYPTCSEYAILALEKFGVIKGSWISLKRICRCTPWHNCAYDPIPEK